jgi:Uma2 family endonuclease
MSARLHRFSVTDYHRMAEAGVFAPDQRTELLDGEIIDMMPIGPFHGSVVRRLNNFFAQLGAGRWVVDCQNALRLNEQSEPLPDGVLLHTDVSDYTDRHPGPEDVFLLVEVADSSLTYDRERKLPAYSKAGLQEFWMVNLVQRNVEVFRGPGQQGYSTGEVFQPGQQVSPAAFPEVVVDVANLLRQSN